MDKRPGVNRGSVLADVWLVVQLVGCFGVIGWLTTGEKPAAWVMFAALAGNFAIINLIIIQAFIESVEEDRDRAP